MGTEEITNRLKRVEGQIRGLQRMVEEERGCEAILTQFMAARSALDRIGFLIATSFIQECLDTAQPETARQQVGRILDFLFSHFSPSPAADNLPPLDQIE